MDVHSLHLRLVVLVATALDNSSAAKLLWNGQIVS
jgi:hypothetical protein